MRVQRRISVGFGLVLDVSSHLTAWIFRSWSEILRANLEIVFAGKSFHMTFCDMTILHQK